MSLINLTVLQLRNRARRKAGVNANDYTNAELLEDFNQAFAQLAVLLANLGEGYFEEQNVKFDLVANSALYSLPTDFLALRRVQLAYSGTPLSPSAYTIAGRYNATDVHDIASDEENVPISNPIYEITGNYIRYKPKPTQAVSNGGRMFYIAMPSALVNTGDIPSQIPLAYQEKIAVYGAMQMAFKFEKWSKHQRLAQEWAQTMAELQDRLAERDLNVPERFKSMFEGGLVRRQTVREL